MKKTHKSLSVCLASAALLTGCALQAQDSRARSKEQPKAESKVHLVYLGESLVTEGYIFQPIERVAFHGVECLGGVYVKGDYWSSGKRVYIPIDKIKVIVEFDSQEDYERAVKKYADQQHKHTDQYYRLNR